MVDAVKKPRTPKPDDYFKAQDLEILSDQFEDVITIEDEDGTSFEITQEQDPMYDIYPLQAKRPKDLFKEPLYDRQPGERRDEYLRFLAFVSVPSAKRTVVQGWKVWQKQNGAKPTRQPSGQFYELSNHWRWAERAYVYDLEKTKVAQQIWIERDVERRESDWLVGHELRDKALGGLRALDAEHLGPQSIAKFFALASQLQKESVPTSNLDTDDLNSLLSSLPPDRRDRVIEIVVAKARIE